MRVSAVLIVTSVKYEVAGEADGCNTPMREACATSVASGASNRLSANDREPDPPHGAHLDGDSWPESS